MGHKCTRLLYKLHNLWAKTSDFPKSKKKKKKYCKDPNCFFWMWNGCCFIATQSTEGAHVTKPNNFLTVCCMLLESQQNREKKKK